MGVYHSFEQPVETNWQGLVDNILRKGTPDRVYHIELFHDGEMAAALIDRFGIGADLNKDDPTYALRMHIAWEPTRHHRPFSHVSLERKFRPCSTSWRSR